MLDTFHLAPLDHETGRIGPVIYMDPNREAVGVRADVEVGLASDSHHPVELGTLRMT